jgi:hypothetical protein
LTLIEYIKKFNKDWDNLSDNERIVLSLSFVDKYLKVMSFYVEIDGQRYLLN